MHSRFSLRPALLTCALGSLAFVACGGTKLDDAAVDTPSGGDTGVDAGADSALDAPTNTDGHFMRDLFGEVSLDALYDNCMVTSNPRSGGPNDTYVLSGTNYPPNTSEQLTIGPDDGTDTFLVNMPVMTDASGNFTYSFTHPGLATGPYTVSAGSFELCLFTDDIFTVH